MENYEKVKKIGRGTYGDVILVKKKASGELMALKKVVLENIHSSSSSGRNSRNSEVERKNPQVDPNSSNKIEKILSAKESVPAILVPQDNSKKLKDKKITFGFEAN